MCSLPGALRSTHACDLDPAHTARHPTRHGARCVPGKCLQLQSPHQARPAQQGSPSTPGCWHGARGNGPCRRSAFAGSRIILHLILGPSWPKRVRCRPRRGYQHHCLAVSAVRQDDLSSMTGQSSQALQVFLRAVFYPAEGARLARRSKARRSRPQAVDHRLASAVEMCDSSWRDGRRYWTYKIERVEMTARKHDLANLGSKTRLRPPAGPRLPLTEGFAAAGSAGVWRAEGAGAARISSLRNRTETCTSCRCLTLSYLGSRDCACVCIELFSINL